MLEDTRQEIALIVESLRAGGNGDDAHLRESMATQLAFVKKATAALQSRSEP